jgi:hypothetical protein
MVTMPKKVEECLIEGLKRFQPILTAAKARDVNEADTVVIVTDLLAEVFGYDKYTEITREFAIRGTLCDLALKLDDKRELLMEVTAIGIELKEPHVKQAVDYATNKGVEWVALTNAINWRVYRVTFSKPIDQDLVVDFNVLDVSPRNQNHLELLYPLTRDGLLKAARSYHTFISFLRAT